MKTWVIKETEGRKNSNAKLVFHPEANKIPYDFWGMAIEYPSDPMEGIGEVYDKFKHLDHLLSDAAWCHDDMGYYTAYNLWQAVKKCKVILEGK
jgi:hypothetical protein